MQVKNLVTVSLTIFIMLVIGILGAGAVANQPDASQQANNNPPTNNTPTPGTGISAGQVAQHNSPDNCWIIVSGNIYDVTNLIPIHSGGPDQIIPFCGKDATTAFDTKNGQGSHSQRAQNVLNNYYIGNLN